MYLGTSIVAASSDNVRMTLNVFVMAALIQPGDHAEGKDGD